MTLNNKKPTVFFIGSPVWDTAMFKGHEVAHVKTVNHYVWGSDNVRTSSVLKKNADGSFETMNTIYVPYTEKEENES